MKKWSKGKYVNACHFHSKATITDLMFSTPALQGKVSTVIMGGFANNAVKAPERYGLSKVRA